MLTLEIIGVLIAAYLVGSIPFGLIIVKLATGKDIRTVASGRTGGTNAMRAAGFWAGIGTAILDLLKATGAVWISRLLFAEAGIASVWMQVFTPLATILGHNYSLFLVSRDEKGRLKFRGGAGGAPCVGGSLGLWLPSILFILPLAVTIWLGIGYASIATMSVGLLATLIFAYRAIVGASPWQYVIYGLVAEVLLLWSLRPNIQRLLAGQERRHGLFGKKQDEAMSK